jgi:hypothetical protein
MGGMHLLGKVLPGGKGVAAGAAPAAQPYGTPHTMGSLGTLPRPMMRYAAASSADRINALDVVLTGFRKDARLQAVSFLSGVDKFCDEAGFDAEDKASMYTLVKRAYTEPTEPVEQDAGTGVGAAAQQTWSGLKSFGLGYSNLLNPFKWGKGWKENARKEQAIKVDTEADKMREATRARLEKANPAAFREMYLREGEQSGEDSFKKARRIYETALSSRHDQDAAIRKATYGLGLQGRQIAEDLRSLPMKAPPPLPAVYGQPGGAIPPPVPPTPGNPAKQPPVAATPPPMPAPGNPSTMPPPGNPNPADQPPVETPMTPGQMDVENAKGANPAPVGPNPNPADQPPAEAPMTPGQMDVENAKGANPAPVGPNPNPADQPPAEAPMTPGQMDVENAKGANPMPAPGNPSTMPRPNVAGPGGTKITGLKSWSAGP